MFPLGSTVNYLKVNVKGSVIQLASRHLISFYRKVIIVSVVENVNYIKNKIIIDLKSLSPTWPWFMNAMMVIKQVEGGFVPMMPDTNSGTPFDDCKMIKNLRGKLCLSI